MNKKDVKTKEDLEQYYNQVRKIRFADNIEPKDIQDIYESIHSYYDSLSTYFKKGSEHCRENKHRSIDDYINLCKYYFPDITVKEIMTNIYNNIGKIFNNKHIEIHYWPNIRKDNFRALLYDGGFTTNNFNVKTFVNQGFPNCQLTYKDILE